MFCQDPYKTSFKPLPCSWEPSIPASASCSAHWRSNEASSPGLLKVLLCKNYQIIHPKSAGNRLFLHCASEILHNPSKSIWMISAIQSRQPHPSFERPKRCSCINSLERIPLGPPQRLYALTQSSNWRERCSSWQSFNPLANLLEGLI